MCCTTSHMLLRLPGDQGRRRSNSDPGPARRGRTRHGSERQRHVEIDHCVPIVGMGNLLARLASEPAGETLPVPPGVRLEVE